MVRWKIRKDVAGASFMALGCAAPEIAINMISVGVGDSAVDVGLSAIVGSGECGYGLTMLTNEWALFSLCRAHRFQSYPSCMHTRCNGQRFGCMTVVSASWTI